MRGRARGSELAELAVQGAGFGVVIQGILVLAQVAVSDTPYVVGFGIIRIKMDGLGEVGDGSLRRQV